MNILAVDAAGDALAVALDADGRVFRARRRGRTPHDEALLPAVEAVMRRARVGWSDLDAVAAAAGPGRFTGVRIGLAFAAAAGLGLKIPALAVSRLEAAAESSGRADVLAALTGWKGEVYYQRFRRGRTGLAPVGPARWAAAAAWPGPRAAALSEGLPVVFGDADAVGLLAAARRRLAGGTLPPFAPFYLKPAGYETPRR